MRGLVFRKPDDGARDRWSDDRQRAATSPRARARLVAQRRPSTPRLPVEAVYGSALTFPAARPHVVANFVQTVDGVIAFGERGG